MLDKEDIGKCKYYVFIISLTGECWAGEFDAFSCNGTKDWCIDKDLVCKNLNPCTDNSDCPKVVPEDIEFNLLAVILPIALFLLFVSCCCCIIQSATDSNFRDRCGNKTRQLVQIARDIGYGIGGCICTEGEDKVQFYLFIYLCYFTILEITPFYNNDLVMKGCPFQSSIINKNISITDIIIFEPLERMQESTAGILPLIIFLSLFCYQREDESAVQFHSDVISVHSDRYEPGPSEAAANDMESTLTSSTQHKNDYSTLTKEREAAASNYHHELSPSAPPLKPEAAAPPSHNYVMKSDFSYFP